MPSPEVPVRSGGFRTATAWLLVLLLAIVVGGAFLHGIRGDREKSATLDSEQAQANLSGTQTATGKNLLVMISDMDWILKALRVEGTPFTLSGDVVSTLRFDENGHVAGNAGCNRYFTEAVFNPTTHHLRLGPIGSTRRSCPSPQNEQEQTFLDALGQIDRLKIDKHTLFLTNEDESTVITFGLNLPEDTSTVHRPTPTGKTAMARLLYRGTLTLDGKQFRFKSCDATKAVRAMDSRGMVRNLFTQISGDRVEERPLYCEFHGVLVEKEALGNDSTEDSSSNQSNGTPSNGSTEVVVFLNDLLFLATEGGSCAHPLPESAFVAGGNEPSWNLRINEDTSTFSTPSNSWAFSTGMSPHDAFFSTAHGNTTLRFNNTRKNTELVVQLEKKPCADTMADAWSAFKAKVTIDGRTFTGCGRPGRYLPTASGRYESDLPAADSPGRHLELLLADSGLARLSQNYHNAKPKIIQEGLWQPSGPSGAEVYLVWQESRAHYEHLLFTSSALGLQAVHYDKQIWGDEGLDLKRIDPDD